MREITFCKNCESDSEEDALFCSFCGEELKLEPENQIKRSTSFRSK